MTATTERSDITKFRIAVMGPRGKRIGWWRRFDDGSVAVYDTNLKAQQAINNWGIDAVIVPVLVDPTVA